MEGNMSSQKIDEVRAVLLKQVEELEDKKQILRAKELRELYGQIKDQPEDKRAAFGRSINKLKKELEELVSADIMHLRFDLRPIDVTAPMDVNSKLPNLLPTENGTTHPITKEMQKISGIFYRMGFEVSPSREIDDEYHMFTSLNFPEDHPARDDYDTFMTEEGLVAPAHTSTMQQRIIMERKTKLEEGEPIAVLAMDRVFRNEDLDARHEHTFTQHEGIYVAEDVTVGKLVATLKLFFTTYYEKEVDVKITPFYFPFTEPSFEFSLSCPFCKDGEDCKVCSSERWIEMLGCGLIHPNVLEMAGIDSKKYTGFAWGGGVERLVMIKNNIEDIRHFNSAKLKFLRQFK
jgi:phenylalanyl-tRNA synthetase alpha chain